MGPESEVKLIPFLCSGGGGTVLFTWKEPSQLCEDCAFWADNSIHLGGGDNDNEVQSEVGRVRWFES